MQRPVAHRFTVGLRTSSWHGMDSWTVALRVARRVQEIEAHTSEVPNERPSQAVRVFRPMGSEVPREEEGVL